VSTVATKQQANVFDIIEKKAKSTMTDEAPTTEAPKVEEPKTEEPKAEEPKKEEETKPEQPKEEPKPADPKETHYKGVDWDNLPKEVQEAATALGFDKDTWAAGDGKASSDEKDWEDLTDDEKKAAEVLGYDQSKWDKPPARKFFFCC
jgi:hypothetical protein